MSFHQIVRLSICSSAFIGQKPLSSTHINNNRLCLVQRRCSSNSINPITKDIATMPRGVKKEHLPVKTCVVCGRPFNWRKKWEKVWDEVTTCSKSCNRKRKEMNRRANRLSVESSSLIESVTDFCEDEQAVNSMCGNLETMQVSNIGSDDEESDVINHTSLKDVVAIIDSDDEASEDGELDAIADAKAKRKAEKKRKKAERRAQREGRGDPTAGQKQCTLCGKSVNLLIRCQHDESKKWGMLCGKCWRLASGGVVDGDDHHPNYVYGGLWKNRRAQT